MDYLQQAKDWLNLTESQLDILPIGYSSETKPPWEGPHGRQYKILLKCRGQVLRFDFWGSYKDMMDKKRPSIYDVLTCLDDYVDENMDFADFFSEYGYEAKDIRRAQSAYNELRTQTDKLREMYSRSQLDKLNEIQ